MTDETKQSVWERRGLIEKARREKLHAAMEEYDRTVYFPQMAALREECEAEGHSRGNFHDNGLGWTWFYCTKCGAKYDVRGPSSDD